MSEATRTTRHELRRFFRRARRALAPASQTENARAVARHLQVSGLLFTRGTVAAYLPNQLDGELDTVPILQRLWSTRHTVAVPVVAPHEPAMAFYRYLPQTSLTQNRYGIVEPAPGSRYVNPRALALMLIPLVAFDSQGTRLGMGSGFYDRFLGAITPGLRPRLVGIAHEVQRSATALPVDSWDIPLNAVVTEAGWQKFR